MYFEHQKRDAKNVWYMMNAYGEKFVNVTTEFGYVILNGKERVDLIVTVGTTVQVPAIQYD